VRVGISSLGESGGSTLRGKMGARGFFKLVVCVVILRLEGLRGKKSTPSIGWEVTVKSPRLVRGRSKGASSEGHLRFLQDHLLRLRCFI
jgi:hypothetical protein